MNYEELKKFCTEEDFRASITQPWTIEGFSYASDGRVLVRIPAIAFVPSPALYDPPNQKVVQERINSAFGKVTPESPRIAVSSIRIPPDAYTECDCDDGSCTCACGDVHKCGRCHGTGQGEFSRNTGTMIGAHKISWYYIHKISSLPECKAIALGDNSKPMAFEFDGGIGIVMGLMED